MRSSAPAPLEFRFESVAHTFSEKLEDIICFLAHGIGQDIDARGVRSGWIRDINNDVPLI